MKHHARTSSKLLGTQPRRRKPGSKTPTLTTSGDEYKPPPVANDSVSDHSRHPGSYYAPGANEESDTDGDEAKNTVKRNEATYPEADCLCTYLVLTAQTQKALSPSSQSPSRRTSEAFHTPFGSLVLRPNSTLSLRICENRATQARWCFFFACQGKARCPNSARQEVMWGP